MKTCPTDCGADAAGEKLMCRDCWRLVSKPLQDDVYRFHRLMMKNFKALEMSRGLSWRRKYIAAAQAAIASARERLIKKELSA